MITPEDYTSRRKRLMHLIGSGLVLLPPNPKLIYSNDKYYKYRYNSNIFYYSGITQEETVIALDVSENKSYLFILDNDPVKEQWEGKRLDRETAGESSGFMMVYPIAELRTKLDDLFSMNSLVHYQFGIHLHLDILVKDLKDKYGVITEDPRKRLDTIRLLKDEHEIELMRKSVGITVNAHLEAIQSTEAGLTEYELEAIYNYHFQINGGRLPMHKAIVASGVNGIYLHHSASDKEIRDGELILVDTGSEYKGYTADIARTWPANGKFSNPQKEIYSVVLKTHRKCLEMVGPGVKFWDIHNKSVELLVEGLIDIGIMKGDKDKIIEKQQYKRYYMHSIGHFIGLDGHDVSSINREEVVLQAGMIITIEPGLYIPLEGDFDQKYRGIGIRIEDNVLVTSDGYENLSEELPIEIDEIEEIVGSLIDEN